MAASMHFNGVKATLNFRFTPNSPSIPCFNNSNLKFGASFCCNDFQLKESTSAIVNNNTKRGLRINCLKVEERRTYIDQNTEENPDKEVHKFTVVMKFGGSSVASAERMKEVADLILSFPEEIPLVVLSAMGKTTNNLLNAGEKAVSCGASKASDIPELSVIKDLHLRTVNELGIDVSVISCKQFNVIAI